MRLVILTHRWNSGSQNKIFVASIDAPTGTESFWTMYFEVNGETVREPEQIEPNLWAAVFRAYAVRDSL